jgi:RHS repeat-associated protein
MCITTMQTFIYDCTPHFVQSYVLKTPWFTGKERDTESGLDYFGARYYASTMGRWLSPDWADKPGGRAVLRPDEPAIT